MVTFLDIGLLEHFAVIFPLLLVFVIVYAVLQKTKLFGENKGIHALIAISIAIIMLFTPGVIKVIIGIAPWFVLMFIFFMLLIVSFKFLGVTDKSIQDAMTHWDTAHWVVLITAIVIIVFVISGVYGSSFLPYTDAGQTGSTVSGDGNVTHTTDTGDFNRNVGRVIFHPKVIGTVFVLLIASFTIRMLAGSNKKGM